MGFQNQAQPPQDQAARPPAPAMAQIPPLPPVLGPPPVNVLEIEENEEKEEKRKNKKKVKTRDTMPIKRTRQRDASMKDADPSQGNDSEAGTSKKKKKGSRRKINVDDFPLGRNASAYDLVADVSQQGPTITWPQLLHLSPKLRRQWSKSVSTRRSSMRPINMVRSKEAKDMEPIVEAYVKGRRIPKAYVDGGAQICVMSERLMNQLGLDVSGPSTFRAKLSPMQLLNVWESYIM